MVSVARGLTRERDIAEGAETERVADAAVFSRRNLLVAAVLFAVALALLIGFQLLFLVDPLGTSTAHGHPQTYPPHYVAQAEAFLHGRWDLALPAGPHGAADVIVLNGGKHYIVYPPFPALLLMPFVAIFGFNTSDVLFTAVLSAMIMPLLFLVLEQARANGLTSRGWRANVSIAFLLYFGSIALVLSLDGTMWFTAHITAMIFTLLSLLLALRRHFGWAALALGCAFFSRATVALGFPFLFYLAWQDGGLRQDVEAFARTVRARAPEWTLIPWRRLTPPLAVTAVIVLLFMARSTLIFGSPLDSGYAELIDQRYPQVTNGPFCVCYVPANIVANFFTFPRVSFTGPFDRAPQIDMLNHVDLKDASGQDIVNASGHDVQEYGVAVSIFVTTPLFLFLFARNRKRSLTRAALWATLGLVVIAVLLFHASGWRQFGARYLFDGYPYAFLLLALNDIRVDWRFVALGALGILINILGAQQFLNPGTSFFL